MEKIFYAVIESILISYTLLAWFLFTLSAVTFLSKTSVSVLM